MYVRNQVPYEVRIKGRDLATGKNVGSRHYLKNAAFTGMPAYGADLGNGATTTALLASFQSNFEATLLPLLSIQAKVDSYEMRSIVGAGFASPQVSITAMGSSLTETFITTATPHGLNNGDSAFVSGIVTPILANGLWVNVTKVSNVEFKASYLFTPAWTYTGPGKVQKVAGSMSWLYGDLETLTSTAIGGISGDSVATFADASIRRLNAGVGRSFRSRFSLAPIGETSVQDGAFTSAAKTAWATALATFAAGINNGGSGPGNSSYPCIASKKISFGTASPFVESASWAPFTTGMTLHTYMGSQTKRKPRNLS